MGRKWWKKHQKKAKQQGKPVSKPVNRNMVGVQRACHDGVVGVFKKDHVSFWAGKARDVHMWNDWDLVVCFSDRESTWENNDPQPYITSNEKARKILSPELLMAAQRCAFIGVDWPDFGEPEVGIAWWETLLGDIMRLPGKEVNVAFCCTGGHGRTGSALSILHHLCYPASGGCPVTHIRKLYCHQCVESLSQINYIKEITSRNVTAQANFIPGAGKYSPWHGPEIGDSKPQGSAAQSLAETQTAAELNYLRTKDVATAVVKSLQMDEDDDSQYYPVGTDFMKAGHVYRPIMNAAGDIIGWKERESVGI